LRRPRPRRPRRRRPRPRLRGDAVRGAAAPFLAQRSKRARPAARSARSAPASSSSAGSARRPTRRTRSRHGIRAASPSRTRSRAGRHPSAGPTAARSATPRPAPPWTMLELPGGYVAHAESLSDPLPLRRAAQRRRGADPRRAPRAVVLAAARGRVIGASPATACAVVAQWARAEEFLLHHADARFPESGAGPDGLPHRGHCGLVKNAAARWAARVEHDHQQVLLGRALRRATADPRPRGRAACARPRRRGSSSASTEHSCSCPPSCAGRCTFIRAARAGCHAGRAAARRPRRLAAPPAGAGATPSPSRWPGLPAPISLDMQRRDSSPRGT
jgi:hypothetical protein